MKKTAKSILWGLILVLIGVAIALNALDIDFDLFFDGWWTLFIIVPCAIELVTDKNKGASAVGLLVGVGLLLAARDIISYGTLFKLVLPILLIFLGVYIIFRSLVHKQNKASLPENTNTAETKGKTDSEYSAVFSSEKINFNGELFAGTALSAVFGSVKCDLCGAIIEHDVTISATAAFGDIEIFVPQNVHVNIDSSSAFLGDVTNRTKTFADPSAPKLSIRPTCIFGSIIIK